MELDAKAEEIKDEEPVGDSIKSEQSKLELENKKDEKVVEKNNEDVQKDNPFAYLERDFTSEKYKIVVRGFPKFYGIGEFKKLMNEKLKLESNKVKPPRRGSYWMYVCFRSEEDRQNALKALDGYVWKGKTLSAEIATPAPDPLVKRRREQTRESSEGPGEAKKVKLDERTQEEKLKDSVTPLWNMPYDKQLEQKQKKVREVLMKLGHDMAHFNPGLRPWLDQQRAKYDGLPCELWNVRPSPVVDGYRNKCEFTVGMNVETGQRTVGFRLGSYVKGFTGVGPVDCLKHIPERMKEAAKVFEKFVQKSELGVFNPETHEGYWRQLMVRLSSNTDQLMLVVGMHPQNLSKDELEEVKKVLKQFFETGEGSTCRIESLYFQYLVKRQHGKDLPPLEHLMGDTHIYETLMGLTFRVSPEAFFQINTAATEILYSSVAELSHPTQDTALIDVCCGTGSIGLCLAKHCGQVLGIELLSQAIDDAKSNAELNNITNCDFFVGKAEDIIGSVKNRAVKDDILAVVDPPRAGLHQRALIQLRRADKLDKLVFLSCDPKAAIKNFVDFARPTSKNYHGAPFVPVRAVPVDMFPYTAHVELVLCFERLDLSQFIKADKEEVLDNNESDNAEGNRSSNAEINISNNAEVSTSDNSEGNKSGNAEVSTSDKAEGNKLGNAEVSTSDNAEGNK